MLNHKNKGIFHSLLKIFMNWTYRRSVVESSNAPLEIKDFEDVKQCARDLIWYDTIFKKRRWKYKSDKLLGLLNHITPPDKAIELYEGDCDDYASAMVWYGHGYNPAILTYFSYKIWKSHTVTIMKYNGMYYLFDWYLISSHNSIEDLLKKIEKRNRVKIRSYHLAIYNYDKGIYEAVTNVDEEQ